MFADCFRTEQILIVFHGLWSTKCIGKWEDEPGARIYPSTMSPDSGCVSFATPVGDGNYVVQQGDCLESIGFARCMPWQEIWNHPKNAVLKSSGRTPNILLPGDQLYLPELETKPFLLPQISGTNTVWKALRRRFKSAW